MSTRTTFRTGLLGLTRFSSYTELVLSPWTGLPGFTLFPHITLELYSLDWSSGTHIFLFIPSSVITLKFLVQDWSSQSYILSLRIPRSVTTLELTSLT